jgi:hypothetical protein
VIEVIVAWVALALAAVPALLFLANLRHYRPPPEAPTGLAWQSVSVLIPARNEERTIVAAVESALASEGAQVEVIVLDDHSEDRTAALVREMADRDRRVRLLPAPPLPEGWCGKQHACAVLGAAARYPLLAFVDADVRLAPDGLARAIAFQSASGADLVSGVPRQLTGALLARLLIPLIHFVLLGFLPMGRMRRRRHPAYAAGCGQLFLARRDAYERAGGHAAIGNSLHDGLALPRLFRRAGLATDLCDLTSVATCRMYESNGAVWHGLLKNATAGLGHPRTIGPVTVMLLGGQVLPILLLLSPHLRALAGAAAVLAYLPRLVGAVVFRQSWLGALLHPLGITVLLAIQWWALLRAALRQPATWKGRTLPTGGAL